MLDFRCIDQAKADSFTKDIDSENIKAEINNIYDLFIIDLFVKVGYYTAKIGELEKWLTKISYSGDGKLYE